MKRLERESLLADRATVAAILESIPLDDPMGRLTFETRLAEIDKRLTALNTDGEHSGSVALIFSGEPVSGSRAIDTEFAAQALGHFQEMLKKRVGTEVRDPLGARGKVPLHARSGLGISAMLRGSVGFLLEEREINTSLADTVMKQAIDDVTAIVEKAGSLDDAQFDEAVEAIDGRLLDSLRGFFRTLDDQQAQVRIVEQQRETQLDMPAVRRARRRLDATDILEREDAIVEGELLGILPDAPPRFSMVRADDRKEIRGPVAAKVANEYRAQIELPGGERLSGKWWRAKMKIREVTEPNKPPRISYTLLGLIEEIPKPDGKR